MLGFHGLSLPGCLTQRPRPIRSVPNPRGRRRDARDYIEIPSWESRSGLRTEEWTVTNRVTRLKLLREHGGRLRLDDDAEQKLIAAAKSLGWSRLQCPCWEALRRRNCLTAPC